MLIVVSVITLTINVHLNLLYCPMFAYIGLEQCMPLMVIIVYLFGKVKETACQSCLGGPNAVKLSLSCRGLLWEETYSLSCECPTG